MKKIFVCGISALLLSLQAWAQTEYIHAGKITFERRTNLEKRFTDQRMKRFVTESNKIRIESFQLSFNDTSSYFAVVPSNQPEEMAWLTTKNAYYQNLNESSQLMMLTVFGQNVYVQDSLPQRIWKITEGKRIICGYECRKAIYQKNLAVYLNNEYDLANKYLSEDKFSEAENTLKNIQKFDSN